MATLPHELHKRERQRSERRANARSHEHHHERAHREQQEQQQHRHNRLTHDGTHERRAADAQTTHRVGAREQRKPIAQANAREDGREEMAAAPPEAQTERRGEDLQHARKNKIARAEHRVGAHERFGLRFTCEHHEGECDPKRAQDKPDQDRLCHGVVADLTRERVCALVERVVEQAHRTAR